MKADKNEEKVMTIVDFALLLTAVSQLASACAAVLTAMRRKK